MNEYNPIKHEKEIKKTQKKNSPFKNVIIILIIIGLLCFLPLMFYFVMFFRPDKIFG